MSGFTDHESDDLHIRLSSLWSGFHKSGVYEAHCPEEQFDLSLSAVGKSLVPSEREGANLTALLIEVEPNLDWLHDVWFVRDAVVWPPDGTSPEAWSAHLAAKLERYFDSPETYPKPARASYLSPPVLRASRFDVIGSRDATTVANEATTRVLRAHRKTLEHWLAHPEDGWDRLQLHADLAAELGPIGTLAVRAPEAKQPETVRGVTGCTVIVRRRVWGRGGRDNLVVVDSYPEPPLERSWRERYPDLVHAIGGYYHQTNTANGAFIPQRQFHLDTVGPARDRVHEQLADLLASATDDQLDDALHAFGSSLVPFPHPVAREWLTRWHWRINGLPWNRRAANGWADRGGVVLS